jgi:thiamine kinase-like enzyme
MNDPHLDIAMFAIYAGYDREKLDRLMDWYFVDGCSPAVRTKIYCYVALSGLLWSNWCEYKKALGVDFGDYAELQYRYAAEYSLLVLEKGGAAP